MLLVLCATGPLLQITITMGKAAAKSLQSCPTLFDPIDSSPPGFTVPGVLQARTLEWVAISFSSAWKWKVKVKSLSHVQLLATPWTAAYQAPPSVGFPRQEYWTGVPFPSPDGESSHGQKKKRQSCVSIKLYKGRWHDRMDLAHKPEFADPWEKNVDVSPKQTEDAKLKVPLKITVLLMPCTFKPHSAPPTFLQCIFTIFQ